MANNASVESTDKDERRPLHEAVYGNHTDIVLYLIGNNADVNWRDVNGSTCFTWCF